MPRRNRRLPILTDAEAASKVASLPVKGGSLMWHAHLARILTGGTLVPLFRASNLDSVHKGSAHGGGGLPAVRRVFGEGALDYFSHLLRNVGGSLAQGNDLSFKYGLNGTGDVVMGAEIQRRIAGQQAISGHANSIDVRSGPNVTKIPDLFRRHICESSRHVAGHRDAAHS